MVICFSSAPFGKAGSDDFKQIGTITDKNTVQWGPTGADGKVPDNPPTVLSVKADGTYKTEPLSTAGAFEVVKFTGSELIIRPRTVSVNNEPNTAYVIAARAIA